MTSRLLPELPGCGRSATRRVEIYSESSLDGVAYACGAHAPATVAVLGRAGWTGLPMVLAPEIVRSCGHLHRYPTGRLVLATGTDHPSWCTRERCQERRQHRSGQLPVGTGRPEAVDVDLSLIEEDVPGLAVEPRVIMRVAEDDVVHEIVLSTAQTVVLGYRLRQLLDLDGTRCRNGRWRWMPPRAPRKRR